MESNRIVASNVRVVITSFAYNSHNSVGELSSGRLSTAHDADDDGDDDD